MKDRYHGRWAVCGDFNNALNYNERIGREVIWTEIADFRECVDYCGLTDIKGQGAFYTWNNKQMPASRNFSRIDRFLINSEWMGMYPDSYAHFLPEGLFDHNPCVCYRRSTRTTRKSRFRYYNTWSMYPNFLTVVQQSWCKPVAGTLMYRLVDKLRGLKGPLKMLNRNGFADVKKSAGIAKALLEEIQVQMHNNPADQQLLQAERDAAESYRHLSKIQHSFLSQKAKVDWIKFGDENTSYFHNMIRARQVHNRVMSIKGADGEEYNTCLGIETAFTDYYKSLLGTSLPTSDVHGPTVRTGPLVTDAHKSMLLPLIHSVKLRTV
ncbi:uncharacterized protein LOC141632930 [Silene latifolia]|uniref:uncharacterized protein LOC141632930 n=1 Tax=Silene latifolia TaxID=37657 RepID=UPI003D771DA2